MSVTASLEALQRVPCIQYPIQFKENQPKVKALIDSGNEINTMTPAYVTKLSLNTQETSVGAEKIDGSPLKTYGMVSATFLLQDSLKRV